MTDREINKYFDKVHKNLNRILTYKNRDKRYDIDKLIDFYHSKSIECGSISNDRGDKFIFCSMIEGKKMKEFEKEMEKFRIK